MRNEFELIYKKVISCLEDKQLFLDPSLSLIKMSTEVGTNTSYLSGVINKRFGCNFRTLVNRYRIEYSKKLISASPTNEISVEKLAKQCGFASVSAYYASFKKVTGVSPQRFRSYQLLSKK